jgi:hypothetical protein
MPVPGRRDLAATKLKKVGDRRELRDYYDLMVLERDTRPLNSLAKGGKRCRHPMGLLHLAEPAV